MKAEELMIGDWICVNKINFRVLQPYNDKGYVFAISKEKKAGQYLEEEIHPIPITPEILEKNGFKITKNYKGKDTWDWGDAMIYAEMMKHYDGRWVLNCEDKDECHFTGFIEFVHELQHALRLCKIKKEIKL